MNLDTDFGPLWVPFLLCTKYKEVICRSRARPFISLALVFTPVVRPSWLPRTLLAPAFLFWTLIYCRHVLTGSSRPWPSCAVVLIIHSLRQPPSPGGILAYFPYKLPLNIVLKKRSSFLRPPVHSQFVFQGVFVVCREAPSVVSRGAFES